MKQWDKIYDVHCHLMNLSHPDFLAFINRIYGDIAPERVRMPLVFQTLAVISFFNELNRGRVLGWLFRKTGVDGFKERVGNLFSFMENDIFHMLDLVEEDLRGHLKPLPFKTLVMTPLIMDFGNRVGAHGPNLYRRRNKPVWEQVADLTDGIRGYCEKVKDPLLQVYPFLGLNPANYEIGHLEKIIYRLFGDYQGKESLLAQEMCDFKGNPEDMGSNLFAGVKLYPPLNCDPWSDNKGEREKWRIFYALAEKKQIPITVHCSDSGYRTIDKESALLFTSPLRWEPVLQAYPKLKVNFAHLGRGKGKLKWDDAIVSLMTRYPNVYSDFSNRGINEREYAKIERIMEKGERQKISRRILFGSDFMINLLWLESYSRYFEIFFASQVFSPWQKLQFLQRNPERFLFHVQEKEDKKALAQPF